MICLIGDPEDHELLWLATALQRQGEHIECILPEELMIGSMLSYRIDGSRITSTLRLHDGRVIDAALPNLVVNRLSDLPMVRGTGASLDAFYLGEEWRAVLAAWLRTLECPVVNPPRAGSLAGPVMVSSAAWCVIAHHFGLPTRKWNSSETPAVIDPMEIVCLGDWVFDPTGAIPAWAKASLAEMGRFVGAPLIGVTVDQRGDDWAVVEATTWPRFSAAGEPFVNAILAYAQERAIP